MAAERRGRTRPRYEYPQEFEDNYKNYSQLDRLLVRLDKRARKVRVRGRRPPPSTSSTTAAAHAADPFAPLPDPFGADEHPQDPARLFSRAADQSVREEEDDNDLQQPLDVPMPSAAADELHSPGDSPIVIPLDDPALISAATWEDIVLPGERERIREHQIRSSRNVVRVTEQREELQTADADDLASVTYTPGLKLGFFKSLFNEGIIIDANPGMSPPEYIINLQRFRDYEGRIEDDEWDSMQPGFRTDLIPATNKLRETVAYLKSGSAQFGCWIKRGVFYMHLNGLTYLRRMLFIYMLMRFTEPHITFDRTYEIFAKYLKNSLSRNVLATMKLESTIPLDSFLELFNTLERHIIKIVLRQPGHAILDEEEYDRIYIAFAGEEMVAEIYLGLRRLSVIPYGQKWDVRLEDLLNRCFPARGVVTVKNNDSFCFLYMVMMGILQSKQVQIYGHLKKICLDFNAQILAPLLLDEQCKRIFFNVALRKKIEENCERCYSITEFNKLMKELEPQLLPEDSKLALDVYYQNTRETNKILPLYISRRKEKDRIRIIGVTADFSSEMISHFVLITNYDTAISATNKGSVFFRCHRCNKVFFKKSLLKTHVCNPDSVETETWHWSIYGEDAVNDQMGVPCVGVCRRCHLKFSNEMLLQYHEKHCFMENHRGERYVRLADTPLLKGEKIEEDKIEDSVDICFADFESSINPRTGEHTVMSYGLYDVTGDTYYTEIGGIDKFLIRVMDLIEKYGKLKIYFHNAMNYDANFFLRYILSKPEYTNWHPGVIMESSNRLKRLVFKFPYIVREGFKTTEKKGEIEIADTFKFFTMSLENIVNSLRKKTFDENLKVFPRFFKIFQKTYPHVSNETVNSVLTKNLFPYNYFDTDLRLLEPIEILSAIFEPKEENLKYFSKTVTVEELRANLEQYKRIVEEFKCATVKDYHDIYLLCDVMEIADVFLEAREMLKRSHKIDIVHYIGMPSASWRAFLRKTPDMCIELYRNTLFAEFFMQATRGGVTSAVLRNAVADETHTILYLDVNGLYPFVMGAYPYPCGDFIFHDFSHEESPDLNVFVRKFYENLKEQNKGCFFTVDLSFPEEIKDKIDDFPFAPEHRLVKDDFFDGDGSLYPFLKQWSEANGGKSMQMFRGLVATLYPRKEYSVLGELLIWYIEHGAIVTKVYNAVSYKESMFLKEYVTYNITLRNNCPPENALGKMVYKLMSNSVYGKTFESPFNRSTFLIVRHKEQLMGLLEEGHVLSYTPIDVPYAGDDIECAVVRIDGEEVILDKPTYIGASVTEYAKLHMYKLFYDKLRTWFRKVELIYTDTDSVIVRIEHESGFNPLTWMKSEHPEFIGSEGGKVKSETPDDDPIQEVIAIRSKVYAYRLRSGKVGKRAKGTTTAAQEVELNWEAYKKCLSSKVDIETTNLQFQREGFNVRTVSLVKKSLTANDGKRFICDDGIHTHAFGY